jgi:hypothetical protein
MNVTVYVPKHFQSACEHRSRLELGFPPAATVGDVLDTVFSLYPGLKRFMASDRVDRTSHLTAAYSSVSHRDRATLPQESATLYLFALNI